MLRLVKFFFGKLAISKGQQRLTLTTNSQLGLIPCSPIKNTSNGFVSRLVLCAFMPLVLMILLTFSFVACDGESVYTITFDRQDGEGGTDTIVITINADMPSAVAPERYGYIFDGYYDNEQGGVRYYDESMLSVRAWDKPSDAVLYAQWIAKSNDLIFDGNGATGGTVDTKKDVAGGSDVVLPRSSYVKFGHSFVGWNALSDGSGQMYSADASYTMPISEENIILYAQWTTKSSDLIFDGNGATSGTMEAMHSVKGKAEITLPINEYTKVGYSFSGWGEAAEGAQLIMEQESRYEMPISEEAVTLYAQWTPSTYTVAFDVCGGDALAEVMQEVTYDSNFVLAVPTRSGFVFCGWYSQAGGKGTQYTDESGISLVEWQETSGRILYAFWTVVEDIFASGLGTQSTPYIISTVQQLKSFAAKINQGSTYDSTYIKLGKSLDLDGMEWTPIGTNSVNTFSGSFDGDGCVISNFKITAPHQFVGFFGYNSGTIQNLILEDFIVNSTHSYHFFVGGLVAYNSDAGRVENCYADGDVSAQLSGKYYAHTGLLVGNNNGLVTGSNSRGVVSSTTYNTYLGGLVGYNYAGTIIDSSSSARVTISRLSSAMYNAYVGGLVGYNNSKIKNCFADADIDVSSDSSSFAYAFVAGLVGNNDNLTLSSYSLSRVTVNLLLAGGNAYVGGLVARNTSIITNCYALGSVYASASYAIAGGLVSSSSGEITNCYAAGGCSVSLIDSSSNDSYAGGLVGEIYGLAVIRNSFAVGDVTVEVGQGFCGYAGGLLGINLSGTVDNSYRSSSQSLSATNKGLLGTMVENEQFYQENFYQTSLGWDSEVWSYEELTAENPLLPTLK